MTATEDVEAGWLMRLRNAPAAASTTVTIPAEGRERRLAQEVAVERDLPILDAQHHFRDGEHDSQGSVGASPLGPDEMAAVINASGHRIIGTVFAEGHFRYRVDGPEELRTVGEVEAVRRETERVASEAPEIGLCRGIVAHADLLLGDRIEGVLDALTNAAEGRLCGIRDVLSWHADPRFRFPPQIGAPENMLSDPRFQVGFEHVARRGLVFNASLFGPQLPELINFAHRNADATIVVDHVGLPLWGSSRDARQEALDRWRVNIGKLAALPNVMVKIGNLPVPGQFYKEPDGPGSDALAQAWQPLIDAVVDAFGPQRSMFESDYTVQAALCTYGVLWNAMKKATAQYSDAERARLFSETAATVYNL